MIAARRYAAALLVLLAGSPAPVAAQTTSPSADVPAQRGADPKACAPGERLQMENGSARTPGGAATTGENLSDKLARTEGVLCPPANVDPEIHEQPPAGGRTPVIPPPGSPGGDPTVRPK